ncbi:MAG: metallophosphoesterase [Acidobacteriota bacterium]|nr:metallophosphoesterase [Acidobacteriota bacterium]
MTEACVTWHHFSDLHMPSRAADRESPMLAALWTDLRREMDEGHRPDLVFCTGDTALTGRAEEFSRAQEVFFDRLAETLRLSPDRIVVVPGNHDCDWDVSRAVTMPVSRERLASGVALRSYWRPLAAYRAFASRFEEPASAAPTTELVSVHRFDIRGTMVSVLCMNSAWLSGPLSGKPSSGGDPDLGMLAIGRAQLASAVASLPGDELTVAVVHHPLDYLDPAERSDVEKLLFRQCQFLLCGHLHDSRVRINVEEGGVVVVPGGCLYEDRGFANAWIRGRYWFGEGKIELAIRRWDATTGQWQPDTTSTGAGSRGILEFQVNTLRGITKLVEDEDLPVRPDEREAALAAARNGPSTRIEDYRLEFTPTCLDALARLEMSQEQLVELVQGEFRSHINYLRFDLEHYPLPLRAQFIAYIDKVGDLIRFRDVAPCTADLAMLSAWHDILAVYRGATRLKYRDDPNAFMRAPGFLARVIGVHDDLSSRIIKYFDEFLAMQVDPNLLTARQQLRRMSLSDRHDGAPAETIAPTESEGVIGFYVQEAKKARGRAWEAWQDVDAGYVDLEPGLADIVTGIENSLQYLHKIIVEHSPTGVVPHWHAPDAPGVE